MYFDVLIQIFPAVLFLYPLYRIYFFYFNNVSAQVVNILCVMHINIKATNKNTGITFDIHFMNIYTISFSNNFQNLNKNSFFVNSLYFKDFYKRKHFVCCPIG